MDLRPDAAFLERPVDQGPSFGRPYSGYDAPEAPSWDMKGLLRRRKWLILAVAVPAMMIATAIIYSLPQSYEATSAVIFAGERADLIWSGTERRNSPFGPDTLANEIELVGSEELLTKVAQQLNLVADPEFNPALSAWKVSLPQGLPDYVAPAIARVVHWVRELKPGTTAPDSEESPADTAQRTLVATVQALRARLSVVPVGVSRVIHISVASNRPEMAAAVANAVADAYTKATLDNDRKETQQAHDWIEHRLNDLRERASRSALAYETFEQNDGLVRGKDSTISQEQLTQVSTELTQAHERRAQAESLLAQANSTNLPALDGLAGATGSALLSQLQEQLAQATARQAQLESSGGPNLPSNLAARAQVAAITRSITAERDRIRQGLQSQLVLARLAEERLGKTLNDMKVELGKSQLDLARMQSLERDANADRDLYTSFVNKARQTDPGLNYQTPSARLLSPATVPLAPSAPKKRLLFPVALVFSTMLGIVAAVSRERSSLGLHSMSDVQNRLGQRPLGLIPFAPRKNRRLTRVADEVTAHLLARLLAHSGGAAPRSILVTSALSKEGKTSTAIALAAAATARGMKVLLVDADLRSRSLSVAAGLDRGDKTLVQLLCGAITPGEAVQFNLSWNVPVLAAGSIEGSPFNVLAKGTWEATLRKS